MSHAVYGFPVMGLKVSASSIFTLENISDKIPTRLPEAKLLCQQLLARLRLTHDAVAALPRDDATRDEYCRILVRFLRLLMKRPVLVRLAASSINQVLIQELHRRLDVIFETLGVEDSTQWRAEWDAGCAQQLQELKRLASRSPFVLANEVGGDKKLREALISLSSTFNMDQDPELLQLGRDSFDRVIKAKRMHGLKIFEWFISGDDLDYEDEAIGAVGTFAEARRGTWFHDGERQDVVVKTLLFNTEDEDEENFHRQLAIWYGLSDHPNVLKLKGGNPFSSPPFFVCENAPNGNLLDFLADESNEGFFWSLFLDVARGIQYLHSQRIVHGSLKAVNILVTGDNTAKIADFGFSRIRTISLSLSDKGSKALSAAIRWKPKEQLEESASDGPQFASDLYALGMSMLEVVTQESPFGTLDDDTVTDLVLNGKLPPRPEQASDDAWDLILKLCASDFRDRPGIDDVIDTLTLFQTKRTPWRQGGSELLDDVEMLSSGIPAGASGTQELQDSSRPVKTTLRCPECDSRACSGDSYCRTCGFFLQTDAVFA